MIKGDVAGEGANLQAVAKIMGNGLIHDNSNMVGFMN